jgi:phage terminase small subunit
MNPTLAAYQVLNRNVFQLARKLGIDRGERIKMKIIEQTQADELDKLLDN